MDGDDGVGGIVCAAEPGFDLEIIDGLLEALEVGSDLGGEIGVFLGKLIGRHDVIEEPTSGIVALEHVTHIGSALRYTLGFVGVVPEVREAICCSRSASSSLRWSI